MLYFAKVLCLILVATATNVSAEDLVVVAQKFADEVLKVQKIFQSKYNQTDLNLTRAKLKISETIDHIKEQGVWSQDEALAADQKYTKWYDEKRNNLVALESLVEKSLWKCNLDVDNWITTYNDGRLPAVLAVDLIKEVTRQLPPISRAATDMLYEFHEDITKEIRNWEYIRQSAMTSESSDDDYRKK